MRSLFFVLAFCTIVRFIYVSSGTSSANRNFQHAQSNPFKYFLFQRGSFRVTITSHPRCQIIIFHSPIHFVMKAWVSSKVALSTESWWLGYQWGFHDRWVVVFKRVISFHDNPTMFPSSTHCRRNSRTSLISWSIQRSSMTFRLTSPSIARASMMARLCDVITVTSRRGKHQNRPWQQPQYNEIDPLIWWAVNVARLAPNSVISWCYRLQVGYSLR